MSTEPRKRLQKSSKEKMVFGVAGGIAEYLDIDPVLARIGFVVLCFASGAGLIIYLAMAIIMPNDGTQDAAGGGIGARKGFGIAIIVLGAMLLAGNLGLFAIPLRIIAPAALILIGILILNARPRSS